MTNFYNSLILGLVSVTVGNMAVYATPAKDVEKPFIEGVVKTANGKPLTNATLFFLSLPGSQSYPPKDWNRVSTDSTGHFKWGVSASENAVVGREGPDCYALPLGKGWSYQVQLSDDRKDQRSIYGLMEKAALRCKTRWIGPADNPQISVIAPDVGDAELILRAPEGQALSNRDIEIAIPDPFSSHLGGIIFKGQTDIEGRLRWQSYSGLKRMQISVTGVGFGSTGSFEMLPAKVATLQIPPLARFARVSGTVAPSLMKKGASVRIESEDMEGREWYTPSAVVNDKNEFVVEGLLPGQNYLRLTGGKQNAPRVEFTVQPGADISGLFIKPEIVKPVVKVRSSGPVSGPVRSRPVQTQSYVTKNSVTGRVTDANGKPVAGADVYAICTYQGSIRQYQQVLSAKTQKNGDYLIHNLPDTRASMVVAQAGRPLAFGSTQVLKANRSSQASTTVLQSNLVLPTGHPELVVQILRHGKPVAGAFVKLTPETGTGLFHYAYVGSAQGPAKVALAKRLEPMAKTDLKGEAKFTDLTPGLWNVKATTGGEGALYAIGEWGGNYSTKNSFNTANGVVVQAGKPRRFALNIYPHSNTVALRLLSPNGQPPTNRTIAFSYSRANSSGESNTSIEVDKTGKGSYNLESSGLWMLRTRFRDSQVDSIPASKEPFYGGNTLVAVSPSFPRSETVPVRTVRYDRGRIRVRLVDSKGNPAAGSVWIGDFLEGARYAATIPSDGEVVFNDMTSGSYTLRASFTRPFTLPNLGEENSALPSDAKLTGVHWFAPQTIEVKSGEETLVTLKPQPQGYIRGQVVTPKSPTIYRVYAAYYMDPRPKFRYNAKTGEFVAGPFPVGKAAIHLQSFDPSNDEPMDKGEDFPVEVIGGQVVKINLAAGTAPKRVAHRESEAIITMGGIFNSQRKSSLPATILLPDGRTPAWGARAALIVPQTWQPVMMGRANVRGQLSTGEYWYTNNSPTNPPQGSPTNPVIVAWLPGATGAAVVPFNSKLNRPIILSKGATIRGRLTVGNKPVNGLASSFRILAAYQGRGKLNALLSVCTTAQADGTFELSGLTAGTYKVQATRDDIWVSASKSLNVGNNAHGPISLNIDPIGTPTILRLVNGQGQPLSNHQVELMRPQGPLTDEFWPKMLSTDSAGELRLEGFETGKHQLRVAGKDVTNIAPDKSETISFTVPAFPLKNPKVTQTLIIP